MDLEQIIKDHRNDWAQEIARLRTELADLKVESADKAYRRVIALKTENADLRAAVQKFLDGRMKHFPGSREVDDDLVELAAALVRMKVHETNDKEELYPGAWDQGHIRER